MNYKKKGKKINFREFKAIALGKDEEEHEINRRDSNIVISVNEGEKNLMKQISFKEKESKEYKEIKNTEEKAFNNRDKTDMILNENKEYLEDNILNVKSKNVNNIENENEDLITKKDDIYNIEKKKRKMKKIKKVIKMHKKKKKKKIKNL